MADSSSLKNIRTLEELSNVVSMLMFNMNQLSSAYFSVFWDPTPKDVELERYNDKGILEKYIIPNRAKDRIGSLTGTGSPDGQVVAGVGSFYVDTEASTLYFKGSGSDAYGWIKVLDNVNMVPGISYLAPNGDGSQLTALNADSINSGILNILRGGTASSGFNGLVKANGTNPYVAAVDGVDYLGPNGSTGIVCWYPVIVNGGNLVLPNGWLRCDGASYSTSTYARLFGKIGYAYGGSEGSFKVPNLTNMFIRGWDGLREATNVQDDTVKSHNHGVTNITVGEESAHTHTRGTMNITGAVSSSGQPGPTEGAFYDDGWRGVEVANSGERDMVARFDASRSWTGHTSGGTAHTHTLSGTTDLEGETETRPKNISMVPIIKY